VPKIQEFGERQKLWKIRNLRVGQNFASRVIRAALERRLSFHEAYKLTDLRGGTFQKYPYGYRVKPAMRSDSACFREMHWSWGSPTEKPSVSGEVFFHAKPVRDQRKTAYQGQALSHHHILDEHCADQWSRCHATVQITKELAKDSNNTVEFVWNSEKTLRQSLRRWNAICRVRSYAVEARFVAKNPQLSYTNSCRTAFFVLCCYCRRMHCFSSRCLAA